MAGRKTLRTVAAQRPRVLLLVETSLVYGRGVLRGIRRYLVAHGAWSLYLEQRELQAEPPAWLARWDGDGVISRSTTPELARQLRRRGLPTVDLTDIHGDLGLPHLWTDHEQVGELAAQHLLERGFRHFGFCGFSGHNWSARRCDGFRRAVEAAGGSLSAIDLAWGTSARETWESQQETLTGWLRELPRPVGILAANDMRGQHVLEACRRLALAVPEEVAVVGVDNDELLCELCDPPLSSVVPNPERIGYEAAALLDGWMRGTRPPQTEYVVPPLGVVTRQSTDVLAIGDPLIAAAVRYIREQACQGISVSDVLRHVPASRSVLERRFRKYLGRSPQEEIRQVQLKRTRQLLVETELPLERIAALVGFAHPEYLSVVFKRETGLSPGRYRQTHSAVARPRARRAAAPRKARER